MNARKKPSKQDKPWYKKPWGITLLVLSAITLTFPIPLVIIMWQKNKFSQTARIVLTVIVGLVYVPAIAGISDNSSRQDKQSTEQSQQASQPAPKEPKYEIKIVGNSYSGPTTRMLTFTVKNISDQELTPACSVTLQDDSGRYNGYDYIDWKTPLAPGDTKWFEGQIVITNEGAAYALESKVSCTAK